MALSVPVKAGKAVVCTPLYIVSYVVFLIVLLNGK